MISYLYLGYDASAVSGTGFSAFTSCGASGPETPKYPCNQQWADKVSWLWPCTNLQFSDGSYLSGKFLEAFVFLLMQQYALVPVVLYYNSASKTISSKLLESVKTIAFQPGLTLLWLLCKSNRLLITSSKLNHDWLLKDRYALVFWNP